MTYIPKWLTPLSVGNHWHVTDVTFMSYAPDYPNAEPLQLHLDTAAKRMDGTRGDARRAVGDCIELALTAMARQADDEALAELGAAVALIKAELDQRAVADIGRRVAGR